MQASLVPLRTHPPCCVLLQTMLLQLAFLMSYERMGVATVRCDSGCSCNDSLINGHHKDHSSQVGH